MSDKQHSAQSSCWDMVDGIFVINLDSSTRRWETFTQVNAGALPMERVERLSAVVGTSLPGYGEAPWFRERTGERAVYWGGCAGCALSHRQALLGAKARGWKNVLIIEDDVIVDPSASEVLADFLPQLSDAGMLYLGYSRPTPYGVKLAERDERSLWRVEGVLSTWAYVVPESLYDLLLERLPTEQNVWEWLSLHRAIDNMYRDELTFHRDDVAVYVLYPEVVRVQAGYSVIERRVKEPNDGKLVRPPYEKRSVRGCVHCLLAPLRRLKVWLNSIRTHRRAVKGGLPGYRHKKRHL